MSTVKIVAIVPIVADVLGLVYGSFSYTKEIHEARLGPIELSIRNKWTENVPFNFYKKYVCFLTC